MSDRDGGLARVRYALEHKLGRPLQPDEFDLSEGAVGSFYVRINGRLTEFTRKELDDSHKAIGLDVARKISAAFHREHR